MNTLQGILRGSSRGYRRGLENATALSRLFQQKKKMEMIEEEKEMRRSQQNYERAMNLMSSGSEAGMNLGVELMQATATKHPEHWGGEVPDFKKIFTVNKGTEELKAIMDDLAKVQKMDLNPQDKSALLTNISKQFVGLPKTGAKEEILKYHQDAIAENRKRVTELQKSMMSGKVRKNKEGTGNLWGGKYETVAEDKGLTFEEKETIKLNNKIALAEFTEKLNSKYKETPEDRLKRDKELAEFKVSLNDKNKSTEVDYDKIIRTLHKERTSLAAKKGFSELDLIFAKDNPAMQNYIQNNDVSGALQEYDNQIEKYTKLRDGNKETPKEEDVKDKYTVGQIIEKNGNKYKYIGDRS